MNEPNLHKKQTLRALKTQEKTRGDEDANSQTSEIADSEMENDTDRYRLAESSSRRSSVSSGTGYIWPELDGRKGGQKRKKMEEDIRGIEEREIAQENERKETIEYVSKQREELEKFLFLESNKITRPAIKYVLEKWRLMEAKMIELIAKQSQMSEKIEVLKKEKMSNNNKETYAEITQNKYSITKKDKDVNKYKNKADRIIIIKPKENKENVTIEEIKSKFFETIKGRKDDIRINNIRKTRDNGILIETEDREDITVIKKMDLDKAELKTETPRKVGPSIIIYDVNKDMTMDEIRKEIWNKNLKRTGLSQEVYDSKINFRVKLRNKNPTLTNWVLEVPARIFYILIERKKMYIEWQSHSVKEYVNIVRCFRCFGFGHIANKCTSEHQYCGHCGDKEHIFKDCKKDLKTRNVSVV
ncbi:uncharacterized protein [Linepithema humile]|uniref:uncharacterized protein n=1 Tax=Linepithema humile TaxID=83485 RepID=UPI00351EEEDE